MFCTDIVCLLVPGQPYEGGRNASFDLRESQGDVLGWADGPGQPQVAMTVRYRCEQLTQDRKRLPSLFPSVFYVLLAIFLLPLSIPDEV